MLFNFLKLYSFFRVLLIFFSEVKGHHPTIIQSADGKIHISYTNQFAGSEGKPVVKNVAHASLSEKWIMK